MPAKKKNLRTRPKRKMVAGNKKKSAGRKQTVKKAARKGKRRLTGSVSRKKKFQARSGGQSGDLQGLSTRERADSESVNELLEEGNAFEAGVVEGVEEADDADEKEVHSHEVPEDDVPGEYLDKDI